MVGKDARIKRANLKSWKTQIIVFTTAFAVIGSCFVLRTLSESESASAQAPEKRRPNSGPAQRKKTKPANANVQQASAATPAEVQKVMAVVNGEQITRHELAQACLQRFGNELLESTINKQVIWQACRKREISVTDEDVETEVQRMADKFGLSKGRWYQLLQEERELTPDKYRREVVWPMLALKALVSNQIVVSREEIEQALESEFGSQVRCRIIVLASQEKAEKVRAAAIKSPEKFGKYAKNYSDDPSSSVEGAIPPIRRHLGSPDIERVAFSLQEQQISNVIPFGDKFVILKCEKHVAPVAISAEMRRLETMKSHDRIQDQKLRAASAELFKQLQREAQVVNVFNDLQLREKFPGVAAIINDDKITLRQLSENCLQAYGRDVLAGEINRRLLMQQLKRRKFTVLDQEIDQEIARAAESFGFIKQDGSPDIERWLSSVLEEEDATVELYVHDVVWPTVALKKLVTQQVKLEEGDIEKAFESNYGERVEVLAIVLGNQRQAQKVWEMARDNPTVEYFGRLAEQYSIEPMSRENGGVVPPIRRFGGQPILEEEAFKLGASGVESLSSILAIGDKNIILKCVGRTTPVVSEMDEEIRLELIKDLREKKIRVAMSREYDRIKKIAQIDNFLAQTSQSPKRTNGSELFGAKQLNDGAKRR